MTESKPKPFYRFVGRQPHYDEATNLRMTDQLIWRNEHDDADVIIASEWWFWRLWRAAAAESR